MRILIVEDHLMVAEALRAVVGASHEVVQLLHDGAAVLPWLRENVVDMVLLDLSLPHQLGSQVLADLRNLRDPPRVLVVSMHDEPAIRDELRTRGAQGFVAKSAPIAVLMEAIAVVGNGGRWFRDTDAEVSESRLKPSLVLAPRQLEVLRAFARGSRRDEIATALGIALPTVDDHLSRLKVLLEVQHTHELPRAAFAHGFASPLKLG